MNDEVKRRNANHLQKQGEEARRRNDYTTAAIHYRAAAEIWRSLDDMDKCNWCIALAVDLDKEP